MARELDAAATWDRALDELALQMTRATFDTWLRGSWVIEAAALGDGGPVQWVIGVRHQYAVDWLNKRLDGVIVRTLQRVSGRPAVFRCEVGSPPQAAEPEPEPERVTIEESGPMLEAVREERVTVVPSGGALQFTDFYIKFKVAFRKHGLGALKGAPLSVFICLALHVRANGIADPGGIETIMHETDYSRGAVCSALRYLESCGLIEKVSQYRRADKYRVLGYAWFGQQPARALWEERK